jgi:hypothetical protein
VQFNNFCSVVTISKTDGLFPIKDMIVQSKGVSKMSDLTNEAAGLGHEFLIG